MKATVYWYATFEGEPVCFRTMHFETPSSSAWVSGIGDVTHFPKRHLASAEVSRWCEHRAPAWCRKWKIVKVVRRSK